MATIANSDEPSPLKLDPTAALTAETTPPSSGGALDIMTVVCGVCTIAPPTIISAITAPTATIGVSSPNNSRNSRLTASTDRPATRTAQSPTRAATRPAPRAARADNNVAGIIRTATIQVG